MVICWEEASQTFLLGKRKSYKFAERDYDFAYGGSLDYSLNESYFI